MSLKLTNEQLVELFLEKELTVDGKTLTIVEEGGFEQEGKIQTAEVIFTDGEKHYRGYVSREGSPFTDWTFFEWGDADIDEVEKREVVITKWVAVQ